jgi:hypothetical protein
MGAGSDKELLASPRNFFPSRKRRVSELFAELLGRSFLPLPDFAALDHHIMRVAFSLDLYLAKFDQSCFRISTFPWLELQGKRQGNVSRPNADMKRSRIGPERFTAHQREFYQLAGTMIKSWPSSTVLGAGGVVGL